MTRMSDHMDRREVDALVNTLDALQPTPERTLITRFAVLYASIEQALSRGVTQRAVMEALEREGLKLHPAKFKKLLEEERSQHCGSGEPTRCRSCGTIQSVPATAETQLDEGEEK